jgi:hypothetical protein
MVAVAVAWWMALGVSAQSPQSPEGVAGSHQLTPAEMLQQRSQRVEDFLRTLDTNHNGMIDADEISGNQKLLLEKMLGPAGEVKYPLDIQQVHESYIKSYRALLATSDSSGADAPAKAPGPPTVPARGKPAAANSAGPLAAPFGPGRETAPAAGRAATAWGSGPGPAGATKPRSTSPRKAVRFLRPEERLPKGLPDWFRTKDTNGDGQISMAEFATEWTPATEAEFARLDLNGDGFITPDECLRAEGLKAEKNSGSHK